MVYQVGKSTYINANTLTEEVSTAVCGLRAMPCTDVGGPSPQVPQAWVLLDLQQ